MMLIALALAAQTMTLIPTDDVWVYPHASDPTTDAYLRVWGVEGYSVPNGPADAEAFGLSYLKWSLAGVPVGLKLKEATLTLVQTANPGFTLDQAKETPIEARALPISFSEKGYEYEKTSQLLPKKGDEFLYGTGAPESLDGDTITIKIDLLKGKGDFAKALSTAAAGDREIAIALTSKLDMASLGRGGIYKVYSKDDRDEKVRPKLTLVFE